MNNLLKPILISFIFGLLFWLIDGILDYYFIYDSEFLDLILFDIPRHEVYIRTLTILSFLIFGIINGSSKVKLRNSLANLKQANKKLDTRNQQIKENYQQHIEQKKHLSINTLEIQERVKELHGLYNIVESISQNTKIDKLITEIIEIIPTSWQYSDITIARIIYKDQIYSSKGFIETQWAQRTPLIVENIDQGKVEVFYTEERKTHDEGPFLLEERRLIDTISKTLGKAIERIQYFDKLELQEKQYEALFNGINDIIHVSDPDTYEVIFANSISKEKYGKDMIGKKCYQVYQNKTSPCDYCNNDKIFGENTGNVHTWDVHNDQSKVWLRCTNKSILWPDGRLLRFELATDITYQKQLNEDLTTANKQLITNAYQLKEAITKAEENETRFKALHNASFGGITIHDKGIILDCNMGLSEISGYSQEELIGMDGLLLIEEGSRESVMKNILEKHEDPYEAKGLRKNGEIYPLRLEAREIPYQGKQARVVEFRDITNQKNAELELIEAKKKAEESDQLKSSFLANMSHEIRTPMNGILGFTSLLEEPDLTGEEQVTYIEIIKKSGLRMLDTVNDIIDISKIDSGQMEVNIGLVNICEEIHSLYEFFKPEAKKKGLELTMKNNICIDEAIHILTDNPKFNSIITNLIKNAIKYTDKGNIIIQVDKIENNLSCSVTDTGIGIPENKLRGVFNRFEQVDMKDTRAYDGSGLGLAITQSYIEMLKGTIKVESESQKGSCFSFTLPWDVQE